MGKFQETKFLNKLKKLLRSFKGNSCNFREMSGKFIENLRKNFKNVKFFSTL